MTLSPPLTVRVEKSETPLADAMNEMRTWLDNTRLQPVEFKIVVAGVAGIAFDVTFRSEAEAAQFQQAFA
jgi:hypothetical protein